MKNILEEGIIYRINNSPTADKIINFISTKGDKKIALAKGAKKHTSRKSSSIELGNYGKFNVVEGYSVPILREISIKNEFLYWKGDYQSLIFLQFILEVIDKFIIEETEDKELFNILLPTLEQNIENKTYLVSIFLIKVLQHNGMLPNLSESLVSEEQISSENAYLSIESIGYVNDKAVSTGDKVSARIYKVQRYILDHSIQDSLKINLDKKDSIEMLKLHTHWVEISIKRLKI